MGTWITAHVFQGGHGWLEAWKKWPCSSWTGWMAVLRILKIFIRSRMMGVLLKCLQNEAISYFANNCI